MDLESGHGQESGQWYSSATANSKLIVERQEAPYIELTASRS